MNSQEIRQKFIEYFKKQGHKQIPSSSLLSDDLSVLLTTAGVQQFKPFYTGDADPVKNLGNRRVTSIQKCFRTSDIDEVGDETHLTFFEMLGNFSFGDYWKEEAIKWGYEFITKELKVSPERIFVSIFGGENGISKDEESLRVWRDVIGLPANKIKEAGMEDNFWGPTGNSGPCGPTTEIYVDGIEIWNIVFNEYFCNTSSPSISSLSSLKNKGIDTGMGLERLVAVLNGFSDIYQIDTLKSIFDLLPRELPEEKRRIITDHSRAIVFLISDGVRPSNKEAGYILRRLIRRVLVSISSSPSQGGARGGRGISREIEEISNNLISKTISLYKSTYLELETNEKIISSVFTEEKQKFETTLKRGLRELNKLEKITPQNAFKLYESYGLPFEVIKDIVGEKAEDLKREDFDKEFSKHQAKSRAGLEKKFGGHGLMLDTGELKAGSEEEVKKVTRLHTATHLLQQALRDVLGESVRQKGSDINSKRTRFDFSFERKLTSDEIKQIEDIVNQKIKDNLAVNFEEMPLEEAKNTGALYLSNGKYPESVKVYYVGDSLEGANSKELCGGPHVKNTGEIGEIKILKQESVSAGVRRIRATID